MGHLRYWWQYLTGKPDEEKAPPATSGRARPRPAKGELSLADDKRPRSRRRAAGFDPYSNDAGFSKPHSWERIERK